MTTDATCAGIAAASGRDWNAAEQHYQTALRQAHDIPHTIAQPESRRWYAQMLIDRTPAAPDRDCRESAAERLGHETYLL